LNVDLGTNLVLVSGARGWLGQGLIDALANGLPDVESLRAPPPQLTVRALILPGQDATGLHAIGQRIEVVEGDVRWPDDCRRFCSKAAGAILFHTAGVVHPRTIRQLYRVNVDGTANLLDAAAESGVRRAVVVSSNSPCGCNPTPDHRFDERSAYRPYMHYGRSKMQMELAVRARQQAGTIETVILRPPWFYGPRQPPRQTLFFRMIRDGTVPIVGGGENRRSMVYIDNLSQAMILAAVTERANGEVYWVADERPYTINEIVDTVERLLEDDFGQVCAHRRRHLPAMVSRLAGAADKTLQALGIYQQKIHVLSEMNKTIACSIDKAKGQLGYRPTVALEEGIRRSIQWLVEQCPEGNFLGG
jgi:nucleoside-diphosphate-sugar epimerase